ncbi:MAG TPA: peptide ABC transporter substrate-binding protein [Rhodobacteraceae bacterium]|nr:peptide ABC transporter substrate-binding protein [Paracoccaceae bacterium]
MTRIDRRALFASGAAAALLAATGLSPEARPREGGRLRLAVPRDGSMERVVRAAVYDTLTEVGPDGVLRGEVASDWQASADARHWEIALREDVSFHDGRALTSADVAASLASLDAEVEPLGAHHLRISLAEGDTQLPWRLADPARIIAPGGELDRDLAHAVGSGCYSVLRAERDRHFLGRKVAGHYKAGRAGWADEVEIVVIPDAAVRAEALRDGFVDVAALPRAEALGERGGYQLHPSESDIALAASRTVGVPRTIGPGALDDGRITERWWLA